MRPDSRTLHRFALVVLAGLTQFGWANNSQLRPPVPVDAWIYSTMPSTREHRPEMAMDGNAQSYFASAYDMDDGDDFIVQLSRPVRVKSIKILTGDPEGQGLLTEGLVETTPDLDRYTKTVLFQKDGVALIHPQGLIRGLRIRLQPGKQLAHLFIREITLNSHTQIGRVQLGPARGFVDISQAPDLAGWARRAEAEMESFWPDTAAMLYSYGFITPNAVNVIYKTGPDVTPVAATGGGVMTVNSAYCRKHPQDTGLTVHETAHVVQAIGVEAPGWLVEGTADYIRWVKFEPEHFHPRINLATATYHDAYQTSATFLGWVALHYDSAIVTKLNDAARSGKYADGLFLAYCGKDVDTLWSEFATAFKVDPTHILTPP